MKKLWVCDFDGTLYRNNDKRSFCKALDYLYGLRENGGEFIVASGRPLHLLEPFFDRFEDTYFISCDGALFSRGFEILKSFPIDKEEIKKITEKTKLQYVLTGAFISYVHCSDAALKMRLCEFYNGHAVGIENPSEADGMIYKAAFFGEHREFGGLEKCWNSYGIHEYTAEGVSKGKCLLYAREYLGFSKENTFAAGDGQNDVSMFETTFRSYAMCSAPPSVKRRADKVAADINDAFEERQG